jgi:hypothetical protein
LVAAFYLLLGLPFVRLARYVEQRLTPGAVVVDAKPGFARRMLLRG